MKERLVTLGVEITVQVPKEIDPDDIELKIPYNQVRVTHTDTKPIEGAYIVSHTTTGPLDEFIEEDEED